MLDFSGGPLARNLTWTLELRIVRIAGSHLLVYLADPPILGRRLALVDGTHDVLQSTILSTSFSSIAHVGTLP